MTWRLPAFDVGKKAKGKRRRLANQAARHTCQAAIPFPSIPCHAPLVSACAAHPAE